MVRLHVHHQPAVGLDLLEQVGDADVTRSSAVERGLDRCADVIGVDVTVPQAVATHDDDRVADAGPDVLEGGDGLVGGLEEVHDLVLQAGEGVVLGRAGVVVAVGGDQRLDRALGRFGDGPAVGEVEEHVEQQEEAGAAGVDHAGVGEHGQQLGGALEGLAATRTGGIEHRDQGRAPPRRAARRGGTRRGPWGRTRARRPRASCRSRGSAAAPLPRG